MIKRPPKLFIIFAQRLADFLQICKLYSEVIIIAGKSTVYNGKLAKLLKAISDVKCKFIFNFNFLLFLLILNYMQSIVNVKSNVSLIL